VLHGLRGSEDTSVLTLPPPHFKYQYKNILRGKRQLEKYSAVDLRYRSVLDLIVEPFTKKHPRGMTFYKQ
jgi:hypothetical protein